MRADQGVRNGTFPRIYPWHELPSPHESAREACLRPAHLDRLLLLDEHHLPCLHPHARLRARSNMQDDRQAAGLAKAVAIFSIILAIIALLTTPQGTPLVALPWGYIGTGSLLAALIIIMRLIACAIPLFLVLYITKLGDIANACCKVLHVPYKYAFTFTSAVHFIPVFMNDMKGIMEAQTARGVEFDSGSIVKKLQLMVPLCVPLLVSSVRKINSAAIAAEVRGFNLRTPASGYKEYPFSGKDVLAMVLCLALIALALAINMLPALF